LDVIENIEVTIKWLNHKEIDDSPNLIKFVLLNESINPMINPINIMIRIEFMIVDGIM